MTNDRTDPPELSEYPKQRLSYSQCHDEEKLKKWRAEKGIEKKCRCGGEEFFIDTVGIEHCSKCYAPMGIIF